MVGLPSRLEGSVPLMSWGTVKNWVLVFYLKSRSGSRCVFYAAARSDEDPVRSALRTPPNSSTHSHPRVLHDNHEVTEWLASYPKICEQTPTRPAGSSALLRDDADGGVAASPRARSFSACSACEYNDGPLCRIVYRVTKSDTSGIAVIAMQPQSCEEPRRSSCSRGGPSLNLHVCDTDILFFRMSYVRTPSPLSGRLQLFTG